MSFIYVDNLDILKKAAEEWNHSDSLGLDIECENNLHHYGTYVSIFQISTKTKNWVIDAIRLPNVTDFLEVLQNEKIQKVLHDTSFDLRIINYQYKCRLKNIFDTQAAAELLGIKDIGLGSLLHHYFNIEKREKFQMADWTKRPISNELLTYAINDSAYLIPLRDIFKRQLSDMGRLLWAEEEFETALKADLEYRENYFWDIKGLKNLDERQRAILYQLFLVRDRLARRVNRPVHFIINTKKMIALAINPPRDIRQWHELKGVHPIVKSSARLFFDSVQKGRIKSLSMPAKRLKRYTQEQKEYYNQLMELSDKIAHDLKIERHLVLSKDQISDIVTGKINNLRKWQRQLLETYKPGLF
jgi:ribonuclease D